jgi:TatD DNase family protein
MYAVSVQATTLPVGFVVADSHCHIDMPQFDADREAVLHRAREAGVVDLLLIGGVDEEKGHDRALGVAEQFGFNASAGVHPHEARLAGDRVYQELRTLARSRRIVAIGEIGLDFHYDHSPRDVQREAFRQQVRLARDVGLPVIIHTREADDETCAILEEEKADETGGVIHCFTGGTELARRALALGFSISFSGILAFPRAETIKEVARTIPLDRLMVETDAPFLAPPPHRGKRNEPAFVVEVARRVAELRSAPVEEIGAAALANFRRVFGRAKV